MPRFLFCLCGFSFRSLWMGFFSLIFFWAYMLLVYRKANSCCILIWCLDTLLKAFICFYSFLWIFRVSCIEAYPLQHLTSFPVCILLLTSLPCLAAMRLQALYWMKMGHRHSALILYLSRKVAGFFPFSALFVVGELCTAFIVLRCILSIPTFFTIFMMKKYWWPHGFCSWVHLLHILA